MDVFLHFIVAQSIHNVNKYFIITENIVNYISAIYNIFKCNMSKQNLTNIYNLYQYSELNESSDDLNYGTNYPYTKSILKQFLTDLITLLDKWDYDEDIAKSIVEMTRNIRTIADQKKYADKLRLEQKRKDAKDRERERKSRLNSLKHKR